MDGLMGLGVVDQQEWRKGPWTTDEDKLLSQYVSLHGEGRWSSVAKCTGLNRSGKSCRLRWVNYLRPGLKKGHITPQEEGIIIELHALWGNKWSTIARYLPGRTDNEIKNYWRTHFKRKPKPSPKVAKRRNQVLQQKKQKLLIEQMQQPQEEQKVHSGMINNIIPKTNDVMTETQAKQEIASMYSTLEDHDDYYFPLMYNHQGVAVPPNWSDSTIEDGILWGDLWNLDDPQGSSPDSRGCEITNIPIQNQTKGFSCGGSNVANWYNGGGYIF